MSSKQVTPPVAADQAPAERLFTVLSANRALVLVRRIVTDIVERYKQLMTLRAQREALSAKVLSQEQADQLRAQAEQHVEVLGGLHEELRDLGCELKDWASGLVDFPAFHEGRKVWLCWKLGEADVSHWHEVNEGFSGRKLIAADFENSAAGAE